jgi:glycosyltransferase involved in cell wall biosynthesis
MEISGRKPITLSICMMVKNEEVNLRRCLPSLEGIADEIIIVDTGSTDDTMKIAKSAGAKVFEHPWEDDFSKHRNQSISYASGDWVFIVDADEELFLENAASKSTIKSWLSELGSGCMSAAIVLSDIQKDMQVMRFNSVRLFRNGAVKYDGIVHNTPIIIRGRPDAVLCPFIRLNHYGYDLTPEKQIQKRQRTEGLLNKRLENNPDDVVAMFYLIQSYTAYSEFERAAEYIERYEETSKRTDVKFNGSIYCTAVSVYRKLLNKEKARRWLLTGLKEYPKDLDLLMSMTEYGVWVQDMNLMVKGAKGFLAIYEEYQKNQTLSGNRFTYANSPECACYCMFHLSMGMFQQGCNMLDMLGAKLNEASSDFKNGLINDTIQVLTSFGIKKDGWNTEQVDVPKVVNLSSRR